MRGIARGSRWSVAALGAFVALTSSGVMSAAHAHDVDPVFAGGPFGQDQVLRYKWRDNRVPPAAMRTAIGAATADVTNTKASGAATFAFDANAASWVMYGIDVGCGPHGLACFTRNPPTTFTMSFRENGHPFDWGTLRWCQLYVSPPDGCFDVENIALDELGHVEMLNHHVNYADDSDYNGST